MPNPTLVKTILVLLITGFMGSTSTAQNYLETDPFEASITALEKGLRPNADGNHHAVLLALRQLGDPNMKPVFQRLLSSKDPALQVDGLLALAEIEKGSINPFLLKAFEPRDRMLAILAAIDLELLDARSIQSILDFDQLQAVETLNLMVHGRTLGVPMDKQRLMAFSGSEDQATRSVAAILLAEMGDRGRLDQVIAEYPQQTISQREQIAAAVADLASRNPMPSGVPLYQLFWEDTELSRGTRLVSIDAALGANSPEGRALWVRAGKEARTSGDRMRLGVMGLDRGVKLDDWDAFRDERTFTRLIADSGEARNTGSNLDTTAMAMVAKKNGILIEGALAVARDASPNEALAIRKAIIELAIENPETRGIGMRVVTDIADQHGDDLESVLLSCKNASDPGLSEMAMMGLLNSSRTEAHRAGSTFSDHQDRRVRSMALLLRARSGEALDQKQLDALGSLASGAGGVDATIRAMAAWLWLDRTDNRERAVTRIVGDA
jgi:hypothetical protein